MKKSLIISLLLLTNFAFAKINIGIVNIQKIISTVKEGKTADSTLKKSYNDMKKKLEKEQKEILGMQEKLKKQSLVMSEKSKQQKMQELQQKMIAFQQKMQAADKEIKKQQDELKKPIFKKLKSVIEEVSKTEKVDLTFEISTSPVVYVDSKKDLTDKVIKAYDKKYSK